MIVSRAQWSIKDANFVRDNYNILPVSEISKTLNKKSNAIYQMAFRLGIRKVTKERQWSITHGKTLRVFNVIKLLQARKMDVKQLAKHLGTKERTAYRYIDFLSFAGINVITEGKKYYINGCPFCTEKHSTESRCFPAIVKKPDFDEVVELVDTAL